MKQRAGLDQRAADALATRRLLHCLYRVCAARVCHFACRKSIHTCE